MLSGKGVVLEPMSEVHLDALAAVGCEASIWQWSPERITDRDRMSRYIKEAMRSKAAGTALPFVTLLRGSNKIVGSTRFGNIDKPNRRVEIGWTWIAPEWQRTFVNTETKLLMLKHAFETWRCVRVELKTDALNERSRRAILRLGGKEEGVLRKHMITDTGRFRDTVYFSILDSEWPDVKERLCSKLES